MELAQGKTLNPRDVLESLDETQFRTWQAFYLIKAGHFKDETKPQQTPEQMMAHAQATYPSSS